MFSQTRLAFDNAVLDEASDVAVRPHFFTRFVVKVVDAAGNVDVASGQVWIYNRDGRPIGLLEVPERPGSLAVGGPDERTLFIGARTGLYAIPHRTLRHRTRARPLHHM